MAASGRNLLLVVGVILAGVLVALGSGVLGDGDSPARSIVRDGAGSDTVAPVPVTPREERNEGAERVIATPSSELASWEVRVIDREGAVLPDARIRATSPDGGSELEALGRAEWDSVTPGAWRLEVEHEGYPGYDGQWNVEGGRPNRKIVRLSRELHISGRVIDRFGTPRAGERIWFLRKNERHPTDGPSATKLSAAVADRAGRFAIDLPEAGPWRVSVGQVARPIVTMSEPEKLWLGGPEELEIVLSDTTNLAVQVGHATSATKETPATVIILERYADSDRSAERVAPVLPITPLSNGSDDRSLLAEKARIERLGRLEGPGGTTPFRDAAILQDLPTPTMSPAYAPEWIGRASQRVGLDGRVEFHNLPANRELRIGVTLGERRLESARGIVLKADERALVELTVPRRLELPGQDEDEEENAKEDLPIEFHSEGLPADLRPAGFHWR